MGVDVTCRQVGLRIYVVGVEFTGQSFRPGLRIEMRIRNSLVIYSLFVIYFGK